MDGCECPRCEGLPGARNEHCLWTAADDHAATIVELYWTVFGTVDPSSSLPINAPWWAFNIRELEQRYLLERRKRQADLEEQRKLAESLSG